ncbi:glycosyltransferase family 4 protein [Candidatus Dependentiae bacterium]|nr:glycosyltransferase family 4 protein [Candidatus Dependentiae bacterium]
MNILNLSLRYYPASGGAEDLNKSVVEKLVESGYNFTVYTTYLKDHIANLTYSCSDIDEKYDACYNIKRFKAIKIPGTVYHIIPQYIFNGMCLKNIDLIHSWTMMYFPAFSGFFLKYLKNKPLILNPIVDENNIVRRRVYSNTIGKSAISKSDCVVLLTKYSLDVLNKYGFDIKKYEIIPAGVDVTEFDNSIEKSIFIKQDRYNLLYAGRIAEGKGIDVLVKSVKMLIDEKYEVHLNIAGPDFGYYKTLKKMVDDFELTNHISFCGKLSRTELVKLFKSSDAFILPSRYEAFGIVLIEAMAAGLPVIGSNISAIPYVIDNEKNGLLFEPDNHIDLTQKLKTIIKNKILSEKFSENAREKVLEEYNWKRIISKYSKLYDSLV